MKTEKTFHLGATTEEDFDRLRLHRERDREHSFSIAEPSHLLRVPKPSHGQSSRSSSFDHTSSQISHRVQTQMLYFFHKQKFKQQQMQHELSSNSSTHGSSILQQWQSQQRSAAKRVKKLRRFSTLCLSMGTWMTLYRKACRKAISTYNLSDVMALVQDTTTTSASGGKSGDKKVSITPALDADGNIIKFNLEDYKSNLKVRILFLVFFAIF